MSGSRRFSLINLNSPWFFLGIFYNSKNKKRPILRGFGVHSLPNQEHHTYSPDGGFKGDTTVSPFFVFFIFI
jgi:hypothetical protein